MAVTVTTKEPIEAQCIAIKLDGARCTQRGIYQDQGDVFCGKHYPYFVAKQRALKQVRREQQTRQRAQQRASNGPEKD